MYSDTLQLAEPILITQAFKIALVLTSLKKLEKKFNWADISVESLEQLLAHTDKKNKKTEHSHFLYKSS